jgi:hypothetical protein
MPVDKNRILTSPEFERTRENMSEFGESGKIASVIARYNKPVSLYATDGESFQRLVKTIRTSMNDDTANLRGSREAQFSQLKGMEFNKKSPLGSSYFQAHKISTARNGTEITVSLPEIKPTLDVANSVSATDFVISATVVYVTANGLGTTGAQESAKIGVNAATAPSETLTFTDVPADAVAVEVTVGIRYFKTEANGQEVDLRNSKYNCAKIVEVFA